MYRSSWQDYKPTKTFGEDLLFFEYNLDEFFTRTREEVLSAEYRFNRLFSLKGYASLNDFYELLYLPKTELGAAIGWAHGNDMYRFPWVDFIHELVELEDGMECYIINMPNPPEPDYLYL